MAPSRIFRAAMGGPHTDNLSWHQCRRWARDTYAAGSTVASVRDAPEPGAAVAGTPLGAAPVTGLRALRLETWAGMGGGER
jgi:hypothetical protein